VGGREKRQQKSSPMGLKQFQALLFHEFASIFFQRIFHIHNTNLAAHIHFQILYLKRAGQYLQICFNLQLSLAVLVVIMMLVSALSLQI
ncbi:MAG: hypothetical protein UD963_03535, partial [Christensenellales bacterium]|nr:hypothetical protein [Christensenellales bacterium]